MAKTVGLKIKTKTPAANGGNKEPKTDGKTPNKNKK